MTLPHTRVAQTVRYGALIDSKVNYRTNALGRSAEQEITCRLTPTALRRNSFVTC